MHCQVTHFLSSVVGVRLHMCVACVQNGLMTLFRESSVEPWRDQLCWHVQEGPLHEAPGLLDERAEVQ